MATELKIADQLAGGPKPVAELAKNSGVLENMLYRVMRLLAMVGIFTETSPRQFDLTPAAALLRTGVPGSQHPTILWLSDPFHLKIAAELMHTVKTGQTTVEHVTGKAAFDFFPTDPVENVRFNNAMTSLSDMVVPAVLEAYDFSQFSTVVDVAGGHGHLLCEILKKYPKLKGVVVDLEHVTVGTKQKVTANQLDSRCQVLAGDFFKSVPEHGDCYLMKSIIHDWDDERSIAILRNCRKALAGKPGGKVVLLEFVVPHGNQPHASKVIDLEMIYFTGGQERTVEEFEQLFAKSGFRLTRVVPTRSPFSVVEAEVV